MIDFLDAIRSYTMSYTKIKRIIVCFVRSVETSAVYQRNVNPSPLNWNEKIWNEKICKLLVVYKASYGEAVTVFSEKNLWYMKCMPVETSQMRPISLLGYQCGVETYEEWTLEAIEDYFLFCQEFFLLTYGKLAAFFEVPFFSVNRNKGFVFIILLPELNGLVR